MDKFTRSEKTFLISAFLVTVLFSVIARYQFIALEEGATFTPAVPIVLSTLCVLFGAWLIFVTVHRIVAKA